PGSQGDDHARPRVGVGGEASCTFSRLPSGRKQSPLLEKVKRNLLPATGAHRHANSGNQISISRSADSSESEPWTMLKVTSNAKSPRIEPGAASTGLVAPITWR